MTAKQQRVDQALQQEEAIQLIRCDSEQEMELQSAEPLTQKTNEKNFNKTQRYPHNCFFSVKIYLKARNQKQNRGAKKYVSGFGTLVSEHLMVVCAHMIINKSQQEYEKEPLRIQIFAGDLRRIVDDYRFIPSYQSKDEEVSRLNDVALLYFKEPIKRSKYIEIGIKDKFASDKILIPKVLGDKIEFSFEQKPKINSKNQSIVRYKIKKSKGESGSPILISQHSELNIYYLVGMHKAGIYAKINQQRVIKEGEGILFNKKIFKQIIKFESELVTNKSKRLINNASVQIDKKQELYDNFLQSFTGDLKQHLQKQWKRIQEPTSIIKRQRLLVKQQFQNLLSIMKQISLQDGQNKLKRLQEILRQKWSAKPQLSQTQTIFNQIYLHLKKFYASDRSCKEMKRLRRHINQILDQMTCRDILENFPFLLNEQSLVYVEIKILFGNQLLCFIMNRLLIKGYFNIILEEQGSFWFGRQIKTKQSQQLELQLLKVVDFFLFENLGNQRLKECLMGVHTKIFNQLKKSTYESYLLTENETCLIPYKCSKVFRSDIGKSISLHIEQLRQDWNSLEQIKQIIKFYQAGQSNFIPVIKYLSKLWPTQLYISKFLPAYLLNQQQNIPLLQKQQAEQLQQGMTTIANFIKGQLVLKTYCCQSVHLIKDQNLIKKIESTEKLHTLLLDIVLQLMELHQQLYSLCCPLEYCMNVNIETLQVGFFYIGHPHLLTSFIIKAVGNTQKCQELFEYYPVQEILDLSGGKGLKQDFRRVDMWMLGRSIVRLLQRIRYKQVIQSEYCRRLLSLIESEVFVGFYDRIKIGSFKKQLLLLKKYVQL